LIEKSLLFFLQGIPEVTGVVALSLAIAGVPLRWRLIAAAGTVLTIIIFIIRSLPLTFGLHTIAVILMVTLFITKTTRVTSANSFVAAMSSITVLMILELAINKLFFTITRLDPQAVISNNFLWKLLGLPQAVLMILLAVIVAKYKKHDKGAWKIELPFF